MKDFCKTMKRKLQVHEGVLFYEHQINTIVWIQDHLWLGYPIFWAIHWAGKRNFGYAILPISFYIFFTFEEALAIVLYSEISTAIIGLMKEVLLVPRPRWISDQVRTKKLAKEASFATPSAHVAVFTSTAISILWLYPSWWTALLVPLVAILTSLSRMWIGVHYPQDVLLGFIIAAIATVALLALDPVASILDQSEEHTWWKWWTTLIFCLVGIFVVYLLNKLTKLLRPTPPYEVLKKWKANSNRTITKETARAQAKNAQESLSKEEENGRNPVASVNSSSSSSDEEPRKQGPGFEKDKVAPAEGEEKAVVQEEEDIKPDAKPEGFLICGQLIGRPPRGFRAWHKQMFKAFFLSGLFLGMFLKRDTISECRDIYDKCAPGVMAIYGVVTNTALCYLFRTIHKLLPGLGWVHLSRWIHYIVYFVVGLNTTYFIPLYYSVIVDA